MEGYVCRFGCSYSSWGQVEASGCAGVRRDRNGNLRGDPVGWGREFWNGFAGNVDKAGAGSRKAGCCWCPVSKYGCCGSWGYLVGVAVAAVVVRHAGTKGKGASNQGGDRGSKACGSNGRVRGREQARGGLSCGWRAKECQQVRRVVVVVVVGRQGARKHGARRARRSVLAVAGWRVGGGGVGGGAWSLGLERAVAVEGKRKGGRGRAEPWRVMSGL